MNNANDLTRDPLSGDCFLYIGDIDNNFPPQNLESILAPFGNHSTQIINKHAQTQGCYSALIKYENPDQVTTALMNLNDMQVMGFKLRVNRKLSQGQMNPKANVFVKNVKPEQLMKFKGIVS